jgi:acyl carrier protein
MTDLQTTGVVASILVVAGGLIAYRYTTNRSLARHFRGRQLTPVSAFGTRYYPDPEAAAIATFLLEQMTELAGYDFSGAVPSDGINTDLRLDEIDSLANVELITRVEERFRIEISDIEAKRVLTIDDLVQLIRSKRV